MTTLGVLNPESLVGTELVRLLGERADPARDIKLFTFDGDRAGTLIDVGGEVALLSELDTESAATLDAMFLCGNDAEPELETLPAEVTRILVSPEQAPEGSLPIVAGVNLERADPTKTLVSPHPAVVGCALLIHPLATFSPSTIAAWVLQSVSNHGREGLDELFQQSRAALNFETDVPRAVLGRQLAFNAVPATVDGGALAADLRQVLEAETLTAMSLVQGGIFNGMLISLHVACDAGTDLEEVLAVLGDGGSLRLVEAAELGGPVVAAGSDSELLAHVTADPQRQGGFWITGVLDNLVLGGAANALAIQRLSDYTGDAHGGGDAYPLRPRGLR